MSLNTTFLGLKIKNPIIIGSSSLTDSVTKIKELAKANAGAIVLKSFFEEQVNKELAEMESYEINHEHTEAFDYIRSLGAENEMAQYIKLIKESKKSVNIPIIASINCVSDYQWDNYAIAIQYGGADAIELNIFYNETDPKVTSSQIIEKYCSIVKSVKSKISIPLSVKISDHFTNIPRIVDKLITVGADGIVMFNRFYHPDIDIDNEVIVNSSGLSGESEFSSSLRWIGILAGKYNNDFAATTGIHDADSIIKQLLAGASAVEIASTIYKYGPKIIPVLIENIEKWMIKKNYTNIDQFKGKLSQSKIENPFNYERFQFIAPITK